MRYTPFENVIAVKEIVQFMIAHDLPKERVIEVLNDMIPHVISFIALVIFIIEIYILIRMWK